MYGRLAIARRGDESENLRDRPSLDYGRELPTQIPGVLNAGIHALSAYRAVDVCRVTGQEDTSLLVACGLAMMQSETCQPGWVSQAHRSKCGIVDHCLELVEQQVVCRDIVISAIRSFMSRALRPPWP